MIISRFVFVWIVASIRVSLAFAAHSYLYALKEVFGYPDKIETAAPELAADNTEATAPKLAADNIEATTSELSADDIEAQAPELAAYDIGAPASELAADNIEATAPKQLAEKPPSFLGNIAYEKMLSNKDSIREKIRSLPNLVRFPDEYMQEVKQYHQTLRDGGHLLTERGKRRQESFMSQMNFRWKKTLSNEEIMLLLCENIALKFGFKSGEFKVAGKEIKESTVATTRCNIKIFNDDAFDLEFWVQSVAVVNHVDVIKNYKHFIGILDDKRNFVAFELIHFDGYSLGFGYFPPPELLQDSGIKKLLRTCYESCKISSISNSVNLFDFLGRNSRQVQSQKVQRFYDNLKRNDKLLTKSTITDYESMMEKKGYRHLFVTKKSDHFNHLQQVCDQLASIFSYSPPNSITLRRKPTTKLLNDDEATGCCTIITDYDYKVEIHIRTVLDQRFLYFLGRRTENDVFVPTELAHLLEGDNLLLGVAPPEGTNNYNVFAQNTRGSSSSSYGPRGRS